MALPERPDHAFRIGQSWAPVVKFATSRSVLRLGLFGKFVAEEPYRSAAQNAAVR